MLYRDDSRFEIAAESLMGEDHREVGSNRQDGYYVFCLNDLLIVIVADGCSNAKRSDLGAQLLPYHLAQSVRGNIVSSRVNWQDARASFAARIRELQAFQGYTLDDILRPPDGRFLTTLVGAVCTDDWCESFVMGDGGAAINGQMTWETNGDEPPYYVYSLLPESDRPPQFTPTQERPDPYFRIMHSVPIHEVNTLVVATDGMTRVIRDGCVPSSLFVDRIFTQKVALCQWLKVAGQQSPQGLDDDTTCIAVRRRR